ncbi:MAG: SMI1/KNR4 family protein [Saprospiraceae bacterium]
MKKTLMLLLIIELFLVFKSQSQVKERMDLNTFWKQPTEEFSEKTRGRTEKELLTREEQIGFKLPNTFRELMKIQNGGFIRKSAFEYNGSLQPLIYNGGMIDHIYPEPFGYETMLDVLSEWMDEEEIDLVSDTDYNFLKRLVIISHMDGHSFMCFDYGWKEKEIKREPEICFFRDDFTEYLRLNDFDELVNGLVYYGYEARNYYFGFNEILSIEEVKKELELKLNFEFEKKYTDETGKLDEYRWHARFPKWYQGEIKLEDNLVLSLHLSSNKFKSGNVLFQEKQQFEVILAIIPTNSKTEIFHHNSSKYLKIMDELLSKCSFQSSIEELLIPVNRDENN